MNDTFLCTMTDLDVHEGRHTAERHDEGCDSCDATRRVQQLLERKVQVLVLERDDENLHDTATAAERPARKDLCIDSCRTCIYYTEDAEQATYLEGQHLWEITAIS